MDYYLLQLSILAFAGLLVVVHCQAPCNDANAMQNCLKSLAAYEQSVELIKEKDVLEKECRTFSESFHCLDNHLETCVSATQRNEINSKMSNVRLAVGKLCNDTKVKEDLMYQTECFNKVGDDWSECRKTFLSQATSKESDICTVRDAFIRCNRDSAKKHCSEAGAMSVCNMGTIMISMTTPSNACKTDGQEVCSSGYAFQPTLLLLVAMAVLGIKNLYKDV